MSFNNNFSTIFSEKSIEIDSEKIKKLHIFIGIFDTRT